MFKEFFKKNGEENDKKKNIENIIVFIIILIITVLIINVMWSSDDNKSKNKSEDTTKVLAQTTTANEEQDNLENRLENILESINGVGKAKVLIKYSESSSVVAVYNETKSESTTQENYGSSNKDVKQTESKKEVAYTDENGKNTPITEKVIMPVIEGAIITAQGAGNANIKASIVSAVEAVTGLAVHKIQVFEMGSK